MMKFIKNLVASNKDKILTSALERLDKSIDNLKPHTKLYKLLVSEKFAKLFTKVYKKWSKFYSVRTGDSDYLC